MNVVKYTWPTLPWENGTALYRKAFNRSIAMNSDRGLYKRPHSEIYGKLANKIEDWAVAMQAD